MSENSEFNELSYQSHSDHYNTYVHGGNNYKLSNAWLETDTVDAWRHNRMYSAISTILEADPAAKWLTVGDGRYGTDARYILEHGGYAVASDITDILLKEAQSANIIQQISKQNAESLTFDNAEFDYALCKESFHHFPRPYIALYEMLRVSSKAIVLIEPNDCCFSRSLLFHFVSNSIGYIRTLISKSHSSHTFEESGNYVYSISRREIEKVALGMNYEVIAFKGYNDFYLYGAEYEKLTSKGKVFKKISARIRLLDIFTRLRLLDYGMLASIIFKQKPSADLLAKLHHDGFDIIVLPRNPHIVT